MLLLPIHQDVEIVQTAIKLDANNTGQQFLITVVYAPAAVAWVQTVLRVVTHRQSACELELSAMPQ